MNQLCHFYVVEYEKYFPSFSYVAHCMKSVRIRSFSSPYFPAFGINTERYGVRTLFTQWLFPVLYILVHI